MDRIEDRCIDVPQRDDDSCEKCDKNNMSLNNLENLTSQLSSKLDEEKQQNSTMRTELEQINERFEQKEIEYAELETKFLIQKQQADARETKLKSELDSLRKEKHHTFNKLQKTRDLLDSEKHKATLLKTRAEASEATFCAEISKTASLSIPVISPNQLFSDPEKKTCSEGIGSGTFGDCFLRNYRNIEVCVKYCRQSSYKDAVQV